jgi:hypothetical protein
LLQLVYISTARQPLAPGALEPLLQVSRRNNRQVEVTGLLVAGGRRFLQALEGPEAAVLDIFGRIEADPRHFAIVELSRRTIDTRAFGSWSMGYARGGEAGPEGNLDAVIAALVAPIADRSLRALFGGFGELHARAA